MPTGRFPATASGPPHTGSFKLNAAPATLMIAATISNLRKTDVLPAYPELVGRLGKWLAAQPSGEAAFLKLPGGQTWLMVKKDLERAEIPYLTPEGWPTATPRGDTHITELLRHGATLSKARELARNSDRGVVAH